MRQRRGTFFAQVRPHGHVRLYRAVCASSSGPASARTRPVARPRQLLAPTLTSFCGFAFDIIAVSGGTELRLPTKISSATAPVQHGSMRERGAQYPRRLTLGSLRTRPRATAPDIQQLPQAPYLDRLKSARRESARVRFRDAAGFCRAAAMGTKPNVRSCARWQSGAT